MKKLLLVFPLVAIIFGAWIFYQQSLIASSYNGLPTVPCIDTTQPIKQSFSFHITITIFGKQYPIDSHLGHDYGQCLHDIFVNDSSGTVFIHTNDDQKFTLGNFFNVWHKTYNKNQIFGYQATNGHEIRVFVNGKEVETYEKTPLTPNENIIISFE